jgi:arsenate reductase (thioredoxin)
MTKAVNILVLCTGNSCRSQMAEGYLRHFADKYVHIYSAGIATHGLNAMAVKTMKEDGIDISSHTSNHVDEYAHIAFDWVITVCDNAQENCPYFPTQAQKVHYNFKDPSKTKGTDEQITTDFRTVRAEIKQFCFAFLEQRNLTTYIV